MPKPDEMKPPNDLPKPNPWGSIDVWYLYGSGQQSTPSKSDAWLVTRAREAGILLSVVGGMLRVEGPSFQLTWQRLDRLTASVDGIITLIGGPDERPNPVSPE
jgi:hypothetical protein